MHLRCYYSYNTSTIASSTYFSLFILFLCLFEKSCLRNDGYMPHGRQFYTEPRQEEEFLLVVLHWVAGFYSIRSAHSSLSVQNLVYISIVCLHSIGNHSPAIKPYHTPTDVVVRGVLLTATCMLY